MKPTVKLEDYRMDWERKYRDEKIRIVEAIGDKILSIEHIGSTSIKGMAAKPIIDILVGVEHLIMSKELIEPLSIVEYEYIPKPELKDRFFFRKGLWGQGTCHLHICKFGGKEWIEKILFRDYLRRYPNAAMEYEQLKRKLAEKFSKDRQAYTQAKEPFIRAIIEKAKGQM